jgi:pimeloyl-ACP methyl ester carboxylesterase
MELYGDEAFEFDEQFIRKTIIALDMGKKAVLTVTDVAPLTSQVHEVNSLPLLIAPGFLVSLERFRPSLTEFWSAGKRTLIVEHPQHIVNSKGRSSDGTLLGLCGSLPKIELVRTASLLKVMDEKSLAKTDVIGLSEGAINATLLALMHPERIRSLILINPAGIGEERFSRLVRFFASKTVEALSEIVIDHKPKVARNRAPLLHYASNPLSRMRSLRAMSECRIDNLFATIERAGVPIGIIKSSSDPIYPEELTRSHIDFKTISSYVVLDHPGAGHSPLYSLPERTVQTVLNMQRTILNGPAQST